MADPFDVKIVKKESGFSAGTNAGVTTTITGTTGQVPTLLGIQCSGDAAAVVTVSYSGGGNLWRKRFAAAFNHSERFTAGEIVGVSGGNLFVNISASTSNCEANIQTAKFVG